MLAHADRNHFHNHSEASFAFFTKLMFALIVQKQQWVKLPEPEWESRKWSQGRCSYFSFPGISVKEKKNVGFI